MILGILNHKSTIIGVYFSLIFTSFFQNNYFIFILLVYFWINLGIQEKNLRNLYRHRRGETKTFVSLLPFLY